MASSSSKEERDQPGLFAKQGSKLHAKMLSKEAAAQLAAPSFRVYYPVASAGAVPFLWESQPGTPKHDAPSAAALPPLTPPPSYYASDKNGGGRSSKKKHRGGAVFPRFAFLRRPSRRATTPCSSSSWSSSSSSTMSPVFAVEPPPSPGTGGGSRGRRHRRAFSADADVDADERCFRVERECCERGIVKGCSVVGAVRNVLATVVGRRATAA